MASAVIFTHCCLCGGACKERLFSDVAVSDRAKMRKPCVGHPALPVQRLKRWLPSHHPHRHARSSPQPTVNITPNPRLQQKSPVSPAPKYCHSTHCPVSLLTTAHLQPREINRDNKPTKEELESKLHLYTMISPKYQRWPVTRFGSLYPA